MRIFADCYSPIIKLLYRARSVVHDRCRYPYSAIDINITLSVAIQTMARPKASIRSFHDLPPWIHLTHFVSV